MWAHTEKAINQKGVKSVRVKWIKGHPKQEDIDNDLTTTIHKKFNEMTDRYAKSSREAQDRIIFQAVSLFEHKLIEFQEIIETVQSALIRVHEFALDRFRTLAKILPVDEAPVIKGVKKRKMPIGLPSYCLEPTPHSVLLEIDHFTPFLCAFPHLVFIKALSIRTGPKCP